MTLFISIFYIILNVFSIKCVTHNVILGSRNATYYCIDKSVLVENRPLVKFIRNFIRDSSGVFSISSLGILMTSFPALHCCLCKNTLVYIIKENFYHVISSIFQAVTEISATQMAWCTLLSAQCHFGLKMGKLVFFRGVKPHEYL